MKSDQEGGQSFRTQWSTCLEPDEEVGAARGALADSSDDARACPAPAASRASALRCPFGPAPGPVQVR